jgi:hypothetical protein
MTPNPSFQGTAGKLRLPVRSGLRPPPASELKRYLRVEIEFDHVKRNN